MLSTIQLTSNSLAPSDSGDPTEDKAEILERILRNPRIPSPPMLALQVFRKTEQDNCSIQEIGELLSHDPGFCAKILKIVNSVLYAQSRPVTSVRQAVVALGGRALRSLVVGLALPAMQMGLSTDEGLRRFWRKAMAGAVLARELSPHCRMPAPDDEFAAGLLRDVGVILLHHTFRDAYRPVWTGEGNILSNEQCAWEERFFGVHHADVGAALLESWRLPIEIVEPIRVHHHPRQLSVTIAQLEDRALLLNFISQLTDLEEESISSRSVEAILQAAHDNYGLDRPDLEQLLGAATPKIEEFSNILGVDIGNCLDFNELLTTGCEELVRVSLETATATNLTSNIETAATTMDLGVTTSNLMQELFEQQGKVRIGSRLLQYQVEELIGRGAMGIVLRAFDPGLSRHVAIKLLAPELASNPKAHRRFALEARFVAALRHQHVVAVYAVNELNGVPFLVMEYVRGPSLGELLDEGKTFSVAEIARIGRQTALGLAAAHEARLIHRDIKPANILVEEKTLHVRVADFGLARALDEDFHLSQQGLLLGTPYYMSPEQVDGKALTAASDLFSLGSVLYTMCTGRLPFQAETITGLLAAVAEKQPTPIRELKPAIPEGLARIVEKLHSKNPADRPPSAATVAESLRTWSSLR